MRFILIAAGLLAGVFLFFFIQAGDVVRPRPGETVRQYAERRCTEDPPPATTHAACVMGRIMQMTSGRR